MNFTITKTKKFGVIDLSSDSTQRTLPNVDPEFNKHFLVVVDLNCEYTRNLVVASLKRRHWCYVVFNQQSITQCDHKYGKILQFGDFENIVWEDVMSGDQMASSYLVRKGPLHLFHFVQMRLPSNILSFL
jgi:hypothetical protein